MSDHIVVVGHPAKGLTYYGPFSGHEDLEVPANRGLMSASQFVDNCVEDCDRSWTIIIDLHSAFEYPRDS